MSTTGRAIFAVIAGAVVWAALWVGGTQAAGAAFPTVLPAGQPVNDAAVLLGLIAYSMALSILAGYVTAAVASTRPIPAVWALALLQLALGIGFEASAWSLTPVWYHVVFLLSIVPATVYGGRLRARGRPVRAAHPA